MHMDEIQTIAIFLYSHRGIFFKPARCGYTLGVTSQASYSYIIYYLEYAQVTVNPLHLFGVRALK
jgi:hypothetical protein